MSRRKTLLTNALLMLAIASILIPTAILSNEKAIYNDQTSKPNISNISDVFSEQYLRKSSQSTSNPDKNNINKYNNVTKIKNISQLNNSSEILRLYNEYNCSSLLSDYGNKEADYILFQTNVTDSEVKLEKFFSFTNETKHLVAEYIVYLLNSTELKHPTITIKEILDAFGEIGLFFFYAIIIIFISCICCCYCCCSIFCKISDINRPTYKMVSLTLTVLFGVKLIIPTIYGIGKFSNLIKTKDVIYCQNLAYGYMVLEGKEPLFSKVIWYGLEHKFTFPYSNSKENFIRFTETLGDLANALNFDEQQKQLEDLRNFILGIKENIIDKKESTYKLPDVFKSLELFEVHKKLSNRYPYFIEHHFLNESNAIKNNSLINESSVVLKDDLGYEFFQEKLFRLMKQKFSVYLNTIEQLKGNLTSITKSEDLGQKLDNTLNIASDVFEENKRINNLILNFVYYVSDLNENHLPHVKLGIIVIIVIQFSAVLLSLIFVALNFIRTCKKRVCVIKLIGYFNLLSAVSGLIINALLIIFVFLFGTLTVSLSDGLKNLVNISEAITPSQPYLPKISRCFQENGMSKENFYLKFENNSTHYVLKEFNNIYSLLIELQFHHINNFFDQETFLADMKKYLIYVETSNDVFIDIDWDEKGKVKKLNKYLGNSNAEFERLLDYKNSFPAQFFLECPTKVKLQITYDYSYCWVPTSRYNKTQDAQNRFCYGFQELSSENFTELVEKYNFTGCNKKFEIEGQKPLELKEILETRFRQLKQFFEKYDVYKSAFYKDIMLPICEKYLNVTDQLQSITNQRLYNFLAKMGKYTNFKRDLNDLAMMTNTNIDVGNYKRVLKTKFTDYINCDYMHDYPNKVSKTINQGLIPNVYGLFISCLALFVFNIPFVLFSIFSLNMKD